MSIKPTYHHCKECGIVMVRAEWQTSDYCWGCRCVKEKDDYCKASNWILRKPAGNLVKEAADEQA